jgi:hypothetical protein
VEAAKESGNDKGLSVRYHEVNSPRFNEKAFVDKNPRDMITATISFHHLQLTI